MGENVMLVIDFAKKEKEEILECRLQVIFSIFENNI